MTKAKKPKLILTHVSDSIAHSVNADTQAVVHRYQVENNRIYRLNKDGGYNPEHDVLTSGTGMDFETIDGETCKDALERLQERMFNPQY